MTLVYYEMIDAVGHLVMPFAPPRSPWIGEADYLRYRGALDAVYELQDELKKAMVGLLEPTLKEVSRGRAEVREIFRVPKIGTVAGCHVAVDETGRSVIRAVDLERRVLHRVPLPGRHR